LDQSDGNIQVVVERPTEKVADRRKAADRLRAALHPTPFHVAARFRGDRPLGRVQADLGIIRRGDFTLGIVGPFDRPEQTQTSPTRMFFKVKVFVPEIVIS
jgi:hypothetical protein